MDEQSTPSPESTTAPEALAFLKAEHRQAQMQFDEYDRIKENGSPEQKFEIAKKVCGELLIHMAIEEAIFYPAVRQGIADDKLMDEAKDEHEDAKDLIRELGDIKPVDPLFDVKMMALAEGIDHHIDEEESEMFPKILRSDLDIAALGKELMAARDQMRADLGLPPASD